MSKTAEERRIQNARSSAAWRERNPEKVKEQYQRRDKVAEYQRHGKERHRKQHKEDPRARPDRFLRMKYGITLNEYEARLLKQGGHCAICPATRPGGSGRRFAVDHNHATGKVRGLLCMRCNLLLGFATDNLRLLDDASRYLVDDGARFAI